ncbi:MAG: glycosyltransferase family 9 protein [Syntrophobacterales bacterium]|nr:glycosyltransferase family 9 protein [Syntrophobacterales bacterium]
MREPRKILLIRRDNIGDLVCTTPALAALRRAFPRARLALLANTYNAAILAGHPDLDALYTLRKPKHTPERARAAVLWENFRVFWRIRRERFDVALACGSFTPTLAHHAFLTGATMRLGYVRRPLPFPWFTHPLAEPGEPCHEVEKVFRLLTPLGVTGPPGPLRLFPDPEELARFRAVAAAHPAAAGRPLVAVAISARGAKKCWPLDRFSELIGALLEEGRVGVVLLWAPGAADNPLFPGDDDAAATLRARFGQALLAYATPRLPALVAALFGVALAVTPDTGSLHIAAAAGKPTVALMPPENVAGWHPWQTPSRVLTHPAGVAAIPTCAVLAAVRELAAAHLPG